MTSIPYVEEAFGILTDDNLYLDSILVKPTNLSDDELKMLRVWVPKYPLTKTSTITCARQEVTSYGANGKIAHLVFDLRGTGDSDGVPGDEDFHRDLHAVRAWAKERFGDINFGFFGFPDSENGRVYMWPLREGTVMESYYYPPSGTELTPPCILYLASYGNFTRHDDVRCTKLAAAGYSIYAIDPLRYLLHASADHLLSPAELAEDLEELIQMLPSPPLIIARPLAAGLGLLWAAETNVRGIVAIGRAQSGLAASHIFHNRNPHNFFLPRYVSRISPHPLVLVQHEGHKLGGRPDKLKALYKSSKDPHKLEKTKELTPDFLLAQIQWLEENQP